MPRITQETHTIDIPGIEGGTVTMYKKAPFGVVSDVKQEMNTAQIALVALPRMIIDWNLEDETGVKLPITIESINKLPIESVQGIIEKGFQDINSGIKKKIETESSPITEVTK